MTKVLIGVILVLGCFAPHLVMGQLNTSSFESIDSLQKVEYRPVVVFIHTDWCKYCQQMKHTTFKNQEVVNELNSKFYFVDFNGESKDEITYLGNKFKYNPTGAKAGVHELAQELGTIKGKLNYPCICILNAKNEITFQYGGKMDKKSLMAVLSESNSK